MYDPIEKFNKVKVQMQSVVTAITFDLWIDSLKMAEYETGGEDNVMYIVADSGAAKNQVMQPHIFDKLFECVKEEFVDCTKLVVLDNIEYAEKMHKEEAKKNKKEDILDPDKITSSRFNPKYTFNNFVVGKSNHVVHAAMRSVAESPNCKYNPLFIYGGVGLGKTHLMHAVGNYLEQNRPDLTVIYVTCEKFTNDYIEALGSGKEKFAFREKYRTADVLMVDDIQFISNKPGIQEEFFHTFNDLYQANKQIIIASDRSPKDMSVLEERLRSRFASGLIQDIQVPDYETRVAILSKKALIEHYEVDKEVLEYIADKLYTNVREMEGLLSKVVFYASLLNKEKATMAEVQEALKDSNEVSREKITSDFIIDIVCDFYKISRIDIVGKKKNKEIVEPRQVAIYLINDMMNIPLTAIGQLFGGRDHTTIMHARDKITSLLNSNSHLKLKIGDIRAKLMKN